MVEPSRVKITLFSPAALAPWLSLADCSVAGLQFYSTTLPEGSGLERKREYTPVPPP